MFFSKRRPSHPLTSRPTNRRLGIESLESRLALSASPAPVLMVLPDTDFYYRDYADTRAALEQAGVGVRVAAATLDLARPHAWSGQGADGGFVRPDLTVGDADASDYSAVVFVGGWDASAYQHAFAGTYASPAYNGNAQTRAAVNDFVDQDKYVAGVCFGVSVLAWARVDGVSPLAGRTVAAYQGGAPCATVGQSNGAWHVTANGANLVPSGSVGDPTTTSDDVIVDGKIITAENALSARRFGEVVAQQVIAATPRAPLPVLMVIANQDFYYQEYGNTRRSLEAAGLSVVVAAQSLSVARPHWNSGQGADGGYVMPDLALTDADASDYSAIVFVGGWGSSSYQYSFEGTYYNAAYNGDAATRQSANDLINDFVEQDKYVTAICHGVTVLAYAEFDGQSLLAGRTVSAYGGSAPGWFGSAAGQDSTRWHVESNGATMVGSRSIGDPRTAADVFIDGKLITAENYDSASQFGATIAARLLAESA